MGLQQKYDELIRAARTAGVNNLNLREQGNVLYIDGQAPSESVKKSLWDIYQRLDPNFRSADVVMNISISPTNAPGAPSIEEYQVVSGDNLSKIGKKYGVSWKEIFEANKDLIKDPDMIQPGWKLKIPRKP